jgi:hypothetical protein
MRLSKIPMPLLIAALVATTAVVVHLQLSVVSVPVVADPNFTGTLVAGTPYLWRGAASEFTITSNASVLLTYMPVAHVIYVSGPLSNVTLNKGWIIYLTGGRPILVEEVTYLDGSKAYYVFKLNNVTKVGGLSVLVPSVFGLGETLTCGEYDTLRRYGVNASLYRVVQITANRTHIAVQLGNPTSAVINQTAYFRLPPAVETTSTRIRSSGYGVSYTVSNSTATAYVMPYQHIVIVPNASARVVIAAR